MGDTGSNRSGFWLAACSLWQREIVRFLRQRSRIVGALGTPVVFWLLIGSGFGRSFQPPGWAQTGGYLEYFFPGTLLLILLFTAVFSTVSVIEDRREGFLQGVLVAPVPRGAVVLGKLLGGTTLAVAQGMLFLLAAPLVGIDLDFARVAIAVAVMALVAFGLTGLGFLIAWPLESTQGFHAIMNLFLIPLWLLSGALFPSGGAAVWVRAIMLANPLTYAMTALREAVAGGAGTATFAMHVAVTAVFSLAMAVAATMLATRWTGRQTA
jgi:ABC-2 type transport system permease protein